MEQSEAAKEKHRLAIVAALRIFGVIVNDVVFDVHTVFKHVTIDLSAADTGSIIHEIVRQSFEQGMEQGSRDVQQEIKRTLGISA